jgi:hypothetical protein
MNRPCGNAGAVFLWAFGRGMMLQKQFMYFKELNDA